MTLAYLALGSNLGDRARQLELAAQLLEAHGVKVLRRSSVIETEPFGVTQQPPFLNQVLEVEWPGTARRLLEVAKAIELEAGRRPTFRWGPRELDIDLVLFGEERIDDPDLKVPHPGLWEREFVWRPLSELRPDILESRP
ncbi:MAG TPA: 2-amino-4-hydroxy-6-hydroxymethyldihydropteridine diphosphokinase [Candidatus Dormibacteraeota bacterium]